jgi:hypothetical protein
MQTHNTQFVSLRSYGWQLNYTSYSGTHETRETHLTECQKFFPHAAAYKTMSDEEVSPPEDRYNTDALSIGPGQKALCECCKKIFNTSEKQMFFAFPPGIVGNIVEQAIPLCCDCIHRIRWKESSSEKKKRRNPH